MALSRPLEDRRVAHEVFALAVGARACVDDLSLSHMNASSPARRVLLRICPVRVNARMCAWHARAFVRTRLFMHAPSSNFRRSVLVREQAREERKEAAGEDGPPPKTPPLEGAKHGSAAHGPGSRSSMAQLRACHRLCGLADPEFDLRHGRRWFVSQ